MLLKGGWRNMLTIKQIERRLELAKKRLDPLLDREEHLSKHGYWDIGYLKGQISVLEDWLDELKEDNSANS